VADYTPVRSVKTKIKKEDKFLTIKLKPTTDILKWAGKHKKLRRQKTKGKGPTAEDSPQDAFRRRQRAEGRGGKLLLVLLWKIKLSEPVRKRN